MKLTTDRFKNRTHLCAYRCAQLLYTTQHGAVLIIFPLNIQTIAKIHLCDSDVDENRAGCSYIEEEKKLNGTATATSADTAITWLTVIYANISM